MKNKNSPNSYASVQATMRGFFCTRTAHTRPPVPACRRRTCTRMGETPPGPVSFSGARFTRGFARPVGRELASRVTASGACGRYRPLSKNETSTKGVKKDAGRKAGPVALDSLSAIWAKSGTCWRSVAVGPLALLAAAHCTSQLHAAENIISLHKTHAVVASKNQSEICAVTVTASTATAPPAMRLSLKRRRHRKPEAATLVESSM